MAEEDYSQEWNKVLAKAAMIAVLLLGYASYAQKQARPPRAVQEKKPASGRGWIMPADLSGALAQLKNQPIPFDQTLSEGTSLKLLEAQGIDLATMEPQVVVPRMLKYLDEKDSDSRIMAVQMLSDIRYAANAQSAVPALEKATQDPHPEVREFAKLALFRIRFCERSALCQSKWRK